MEPQTAFSADVFKVGIRVPPFWHYNPVLWFQQLEGQFALNGVTTNTIKFYYVASYLNLKCMQEVEDVVQNPPDKGKYGRLEEELIRRLSTSQEQRIQLLEREEKETEHHRSSCDTSGNWHSSVPDEFLITIWLNRLPSSTRSILATRIDSPLEKIAELADKIKEFNPTGQCAAVNTPDSRFDVLCDQMSCLTQQVAELAQSVANVQIRHRSRSRSPAHRRWKKWNRSRSPSESRVCWYHRRFKERSTRYMTLYNYNNN
ncbi:uncharacterized protein LOC143174457 [Nomia melanderi]|uniref:uncharacterized protein LOC143174457 n=1 Tax=Nomia melanderi TaxID=2448451 RepID=UPI003FCE6C70